IRAAGENAGSYAISQNPLAATSDYSLTYVGADFAINPATLSISADADPSTAALDAFYKDFGAGDPTLTYRIIVSSSFPFVVGRGPRRPSPRRTKGVPKTGHRFLEILERAPRGPAICLDRKSMLQGSGPALPEVRDVQRESARSAAPSRLTGWSSCSTLSYT